MPKAAVGFAKQPLFFRNLDFLPIAIGISNYPT